MLTDAILQLLQNKYEPSSDEKREYLKYVWQNYERNTEPASPRLYFGAPNDWIPEGPVADSYEAITEKGAGE